MKNMKHLKNLFVGAFAVAMVACNDNSTTTATDKDSTTEQTNANNNTSTGVAEKDAQFVSDVTASNLAEIKMAQLAQQKGTNQEVKDIAKMLETDHSAVLSDLRNFASSKSITVPTEEKQDAKDMNDKLSKKSGKEFDKDWVEHMIDGHKKSISKFESAQNDLTDAELKTWAGNTLPKLRTHLAKLQQCETNLK